MRLLKFVLFGPFALIALTIIVFVYVVVVTTCSVIELLHELLSRR